MQHENQACPPALSDGGGIRQGAKSDLLACLEDVSQPRSEAPPTSCIVLDGAVIVQMLKLATAKSFNEYAHEVFMLYMPMSKFQQTTQLDLVWDGYLPDYLKGSTRAKRGKGVRRRVLGRASLLATGSASSESTTTRRSCSVSCLAPSSTPSSSQRSSWSSRIEILS